MADRFRQVFGTAKPVIAMVHFGALPGAPLYEPAGGIAALCDGVVQRSRGAAGRRLRCGHVRQ